MAESLAFVGAEDARRNEQLFVDELLDEWVKEWSKQAVAEPATEVATTAPVNIGLAVTDIEGIPF